MYHSQSRPSPHSICPWVTWLLICRIDLISKVLFKCSITPRQPWSVSSFCLESGWIANVWSVAAAKHLATEARPCRLVIRALKPGRGSCCCFFLNLTYRWRNLNTRATKMAESSLKEAAVPCSRLCRKQLLEILILKYWWMITAASMAASRWKERSGFLELARWHG